MKFAKLLIVFIFLSISFSCKKQSKPFPRFSPSISKSREPSILDKYVCENIGEVLFEQAIYDIQNYDIDLIEKLPNCFRSNRNLILKAVFLNPSQFKHSSSNLKLDKNFIKQLVKISPKTLKYADEKIRSDEIFMASATFLNRDSLQYATKALTDNKIFMRQMIINDSRNYIFASKRLKELEEFAKIAFKDNGMLLLYAPESIKNNKDLVKVAFESNRLSIKYADISLQQDKEFTIQKGQEDFLLHTKLSNFLNKNYVIEDKEGNFGYKISNKAKQFPNKKLIDRNYVVKWQKILNQNPNNHFAQLKLIPVKSRNFNISWREDFKEYPILIEKIEKFLKKREVDDITISSLETTYLWKIKDNPLTFGFNLYLLRDSSNSALGTSFANITSLTAIVQKKGSGWKMTVIEVTFNSEVEMSVNYENGHKNYIIWDLYSNNNSQYIIFKTRENFKDFFEIFAEKNGGKYELFYRFEPNAGKITY